MAGWVGILRFEQSDDCCACCLSPTSVAGDRRGESIGAVWEVKRPGKVVDMMDFFFVLCVSLKHTRTLESYGVLPIGLAIT